MNSIHQSIITAWPSHVFHELNEACCMHISPPHIHKSLRDLQCSLFNGRTSYFHRVDRVRFGKWELGKVREVDGRLPVKAKYPTGIHPCRRAPLPNVFLVSGNGMDPSIPLFPAFLANPPPPPFSLDFLNQTSI